VTPDAAGGEPPAGLPAADDAERADTDAASWFTGARPVPGTDTGPPPHIRPYLNRAAPVVRTEGASLPLPVRVRNPGALAVPRRRRPDEPSGRTRALPPGPTATPRRDAAPPEARTRHGAGWAGRARDGDDEPPPDAVPRPFVLTAGRVATEDPYIGMETQVTARSGGSPPGDLAPQLSAIVTLCAEPTSVAEISARLRMHLGVARILVADLHAAGLLDVPGEDAGKATDPDLIMRVMRGVRDLS